MNIKVRFSEPFWRKIGQRNLDIDIAEGKNIDGLLKKLSKNYPEFGLEIADYPPMIFQGQDVIQQETLLSDGDVIFLMWPITGG